VGVGEEEEKEEEEVEEEEEEREEEQEEEEKEEEEKDSTSVQRLFSKQTRFIDATSVESRELILNTQHPPCLRAAVLAGLQVHRGALAAVHRGAAPVV